MYAATSPSDEVRRSVDIVPLRRWADGAAEIGVHMAAGETRLSHLYQSDPCRVLFPRTPAAAPKECVVVTTSGGVVGGDRLRFGVEAGAGTRAVFTTQAAEKIYRSAGALSEIDVAVRIGVDARAEWMPQETILFDNARLRRETRVELAESASLVAGEIVVFGRRAHGEVFRNGFLHDGWRVHRDGQLVWADALRLDGDVGHLFKNAHAFGHAAAVGMILVAGPSAAETVKPALKGLGDGCAATVIDDLAIVRFVNPDARELRCQFTACWMRIRQERLGFPRRPPRVWEV